MQTRTFVTLDPDVNSPETDRGPTLSPDSNVLVFVSDRAPTLGGLDLWIDLRSTPGDVVRPSASGSSGADQSPCLVWP